MNASCLGKAEKGHSRSLEQKVQGTVAGAEAGEASKVRSQRVFYLKLRNRDSILKAMRIF
jgi:hypothetical protein